MKCLIKTAIIDKRINGIPIRDFYRIRTLSLHFATNNKYHQWYISSSQNKIHNSTCQMVKSQLRVRRYTFEKYYITNYKLTLDFNSVPAGVLWCFFSPFLTEAADASLCFCFCLGFRVAAEVIWRSRIRCSGEESASYTKNGVKRRELLWRRRSRINSVLAKGGGCEHDFIKCKYCTIKRAKDFDFARTTF